MSSHKKKTPAEELLESLLNEVGSTPEEGVLSLDSDDSSNSILGTTVHADDHNAETAQGFVSFESLSGQDDHQSSDHNHNNENILQSTVIDQPRQQKTAIKETSIKDSQYGEKTNSDYEATNISPSSQNHIHQKKEIKVEDALAELNKNFQKEAAVEPAQPASLFSSPPVMESQPYSSPAATVASVPPPIPVSMHAQPSYQANNDSTQAVESESQMAHGGDSTVAVNGASSNYQNKMQAPEPSMAFGDSEKTVAVTGFQVRPEENLEDRVKVSVGKQSRSSGFVSWNNGSVDGNLNQADNLRMAQEKIIELENENERLRRQNEELIAASEIIKERSDLLTSQLTEFKNDQDGLEQSFKNEMTLLKNHLSRKDAELQRAQFKVDELESKLKFDMKKIRVRERELENRLELVRAEKNAISKNKDEQILDLRRKMDILQMEVDSYRQKCVELNKQIENSQDSFKRTTRALRLAMANLELQEENKVQLKKAD